MNMTCVALDGGGRRGNQGTRSAGHKGEDHPGKKTHLRGAKGNARPPQRQVPRGSVGGKKDTLTLSAGSNRLRGGGEIRPRLRGANSISRTVQKGRI